MLEIDIVLTEMRERAATYLNGTEAGLLGSKRFFKQLLGGIAAAIVLAPDLNTSFCHYFSFFGLCGSADLDKLGKEIEFLDGAVRTITPESGERIHLLSHSLNKKQGQSKMISHNSNDNFHKIRNVLGELINNTDIGVTHWGPVTTTDRAQQWLLLSLMWE